VDSPVDGIEGPAGKAEACRGDRVEKGEYEVMELGWENGV
jgi:hypothetical protein